MDNNTCPVCNADLETGAHDMDKHREQLNRVGGNWKDDERAEREAAKNSGRHPAGRRRDQGAHRNG